MSQALIIRKLISGLLLIVFSISTLPKSYIHNAIADHQDLSHPCHHKAQKAPCIKEAGIDCHFTNLVVDFPYQYSAGGYHFDVVTGVAAYVLAPFINAPCSTTLSKEGRGPPLLA